MANRKMKFEENQRGKFYVDRSCVCCDTCFDTTPKFFVQATQEKDAHSYVKAQPTTAEEETAIYEAIELCPVGAIGDDGELPEETADTIYDENGNPDKVYH